MAFSDSLFTVLEQADSTNNYAMAQLHAGLASHGDAFYTSCQTQGRGQRGRSWVAHPGDNIALSIVLEPAYFTAANQFPLSMAISLAFYDFFSSVVPDEVTIKWPNDLYWRDRKAGGILIENVLKGTQWKHAIVGMGLNINQTQFDPALQNPVSLKQITGQHWDPEALARQLHQQVLRQYEALVTGAFTPLWNRYQQQLYKLNQPVNLQTNQEVVAAKVLGVTEKGQLQVQLDGGATRTFEFGEVSWERG